MNKWLVIAGCAVAVLLIGIGLGRTMLHGPSRAVVGEKISWPQIREFYYTVSASTNPACYQRYQFGIEGEKYYFFHETREGAEWPLTEKSTTLSGRIELTQEQWERFLDLINGGAVQRRSESTVSGNSGPFLYLYWDGDRGECQEFSFAEEEKLSAFELFCRELASE